MIVCHPLVAGVGSPAPSGSKYEDPRGSTTNAPNMPITVNSRSLLNVWNCRTPSWVCGLMYHSKSAVLFCATIESGLVVVAAAPVALTTMLEP